MKIAILGAGFCGLAAAKYALDAGHEVTLFDPGGVGAGASGVASGLLHKFPGEKALLSQDGDAAFIEALDLLRYAGDVFVQEGIERYAVSDAQRELFAAKENWDGEKLIFPDGVTVFAPRYLQSLFEKAKERGMRFDQAHLAEDDFPEFERVIVATGAGIRSFSFFDTLPLRFIKGQVLICKRPQWLTRSIIAKGYIATTDDPNVCIVGSTYEHGYISDTPDREVATSIIFPRIASTVPFEGEFEVLDVKSGVRVANKHHYFPLAEEVKSGVHVLTGMGSRGLLYHALFARKLVTRL